MNANGPTANTSALIAAMSRFSASLSGIKIPPLVTLSVAIFFTTRFTPVGFSGKLTTHILDYLNKTSDALAEPDALCIAQRGLAWVVAQRAAKAQLLIDRLAVLL